MRATIEIDNQLLSEAMARAAASGRTLSAVVEDALRQAMAGRPMRGSERTTKLPTFSGGRLLPGVDLSDNAALLSLMEGPDR
jgi:hypothetical protein